MIKAKYVMKKSTVEIVNHFVELVGGKSWERTAHRCTGKWRGTTDYGILIDGIRNLFVTNGMAGFEEKVKTWVDMIVTFRAKKGHYLQVLHKQQEIDNAHAKAEGLHAVKLLDIDILSPDAESDWNFFQPYMLIEVKGKRFKHVTTNYAFAIVKDIVEEEIERYNSRELLTAGAVESPDYVVWNTRFSTSDRLYKIM